jgi:hypothetical protein
MPDESRAIVEDAVLTALADRLEAAMELASDAAAVSALEDIARLCDEAARIARAGAQLLA